MPQTETATVTLGEDGIITVRVNHGAYQSLVNAKQNLDAALGARDGRRRPLLVDISGAQPLDADVRHYYSGQALVDGFTALGLVVEASPFGLMMGNIYFRVARPGIPTKLFTRSGEAAEWLRGHVAQS